MPTILIIEDEAKMRRLLELNLGDDGFKTLSAGDAETGLKLLASEPVHLVLTDLKLPGMSGLEFLHSAKQQNPALPIVVMPAFGSVETAVGARKAVPSAEAPHPSPPPERARVFSQRAAIHPSARGIP